MELGSTIWFQQDSLHFLIEDNHNWHGVKDFHAAMQSTWVVSKAERAFLFLLMLSSWFPIGMAAMTCGKGNFVPELYGGSSSDDAPEGQLCKIMAMIIQSYLVLHVHP